MVKRFILCFEVNHLTDATLNYQLSTPKTGNLRRVKNSSRSLCDSSSEDTVVFSMDAPAA